MRKGQQQQQQSSVWSVNAHTGIHTFNLGDGQVAAMVSDPVQKESFQRLVQHCVPKRSVSKTKGYRINCTFRVSESAKVKNLVSAEADETVMIIKPHCAVKLWSSMLSRGEKMVLHAELKGLVDAHGRPDVTTVFGRKHTNRGRLVLELAHTEGQTYTYGGKTTHPGIAFGNAAKLLIRNKIAPKLGVEPEQIWAHVVFYPDASTSLGWHGDSEQGINPHVVLGLTFLEHPEAGVRPFQVRRRDYKRIRTLRTKMDERQKRGMDPAMSNEEVVDLEGGMPDSPLPPSKKLKRSDSMTVIDEWLRSKQ